MVASVAASRQRTSGHEQMERGMTAVVAVGKPEAEEENLPLPFQAQVLKIYEHPYSQFAVAAIIFLNFFISAAQAQILPEDDTGVAVFFGFEVTFNVIFLIELILNMYANFFWKFWKNGWNVFDVAIVLVS